MNVKTKASSQHAQKQTVRFAVGEGLQVDRKPNKVSLGSFDFIKGVAICIVMLGHIALDFEISRLTWFHPLFALLQFLEAPFLPLFFIISGYMFVPNGKRRTFKKMVVAFLKPYLIVTLAFSLLQPIRMYLQTRSMEQAIDRFLSVTLAFLLGIPIPGKVLFGYKLYNCTIVWFLLALFWAYNILNLILKRKRLLSQVIWVLLCAVLGYLLFQVDFVYFCIPHGLIATGYFYAGYLLKKSRLLEKGLPQKWMYYVWVVLALLYASWGTYDLCYGLFRFFPVDYVGAALLAMLLLVIGIHVGRYEWKIFDIVNSVGIHSYWILCIHSIEQKCLPWNTFIRMTEAWPNQAFILTLVLKAIIIAGCCKLLKKLNRYRYRKEKKAYVQKKLYSADA